MPPSTGPDDYDDVLVRVENLVKYFPVRAGGLVKRTVGHVHAVDDVSLSIPRGQTLGLVGETGSGKSTLARCVAGLIPVTSGRVTFDGRDITNLSRSAMRPIRRSIQMIFGVDPSHTDPTTHLPFSWRRSASTASVFSSFFASGQFP